MCSDMLDHDHQVLEEVLGEYHAKLLIEYGYNSLEDVDNATDSELRDIHGIGYSTVRDIRDKIRSTSESIGVSDQPATVDSEVKPVDEEAEAAEGEIADLPSAVDAPVETSEASNGGIDIRSLVPAMVRLTAPSGLTYEWANAGSVVSVLESDVEFVFAKNSNARRACCGSSGERIYFELA